MSTTDRPLDPTSGRHPVNVGHLVMGLAFVGLVGVWALVQGGVVEGHDVRWLLPLPWVVAGLAGLLASTLTSRDRWGTRQTGWVAPEQPAADWGTHHTGWVTSAPDAPTAPDTTPDTDPDDRADPEGPTGAGR
jgi:hypothetical protein